MNEWNVNLVLPVPAPPLYFIFQVNFCSYIHTLVLTPYFCWYLDRSKSKREFVNFFSDIVWASPCRSECNCCGLVIETLTLKLCRWTSSPILNPRTPLVKVNPTTVARSLLQIESDDLGFWLKISVLVIWYFTNTTFMY